MSLSDHLRMYDDADAIIIIFGDMHLYVNKKFVYDYLKSEFLRGTFTKVINQEGIPIFISDELNAGPGYNGPIM